MRKSYLIYQARFPVTDKHIPRFVAANTKGKLQLRLSKLLVGARGSVE